MKLTFILLTASFLQLSATGLSQNVTISLKDAPVEKVFREIERQTSIGFLYTKKMLQESGKVTINVKNVSVEDVLKQCFYGKSLDFVIQNNTIVITKKYKAVIEEENPVAPPAIDIKGRVTDTEGEPLAGVSVLVTGTNTGTTTNANGEYSL
ncbi:MAG TPA: secretin and TonB N-terminal domain-containing protein, partial [Chitinophagaceae bacterium]|nr:secretin and TonB N-terminal domain-containing protein [Chitinophagaceae bacterium]